MSQFADLVRFIPTAGGTGNWTFGSVVGGCQSPSQANVQNGVSYKVYAVSSDLTQWEISTGLYNSATGTFARTTVLYNSLGTGTSTPGQSGGGALVNFTTIPQVSIVALAEDLGFANGVPAVFSSTLSSDVLVSGSVWTTALSASQGTTGIFLVTAQITIVDSSASQFLKGRITDGTTVFASGGEINFNATNGISISLSRIVTNPAGNILLQGFDASGNGTIKFNYTGQSKDTFLDVARIG